VEALGRAGRGGCDICAEMNGATRARGRELDNAEAVIEGEVGIQPPPKIRVELLGPIHIRDRDHEHLELHVDTRGSWDNLVIGCYFFQSIHSGSSFASDAYQNSYRGCSWVQLARQPGFWRYAIEAKPFVKRLARDIASRLSKRGPEWTVEYPELPLGRHEHSQVS
jgi:hypothetical protein